jgi:hypothetical protein
MKEEYFNGKCTVSLEEGIRQGVWYIIGVWTWPRDRNQGHARDALEQVVADADREGVELVLSVMPVNVRAEDDFGPEYYSPVEVSVEGLQDLYASVGFQPFTNATPSMLHRLPQGTRCTTSETDTSQGHSAPTPRSAPSAESKDG